MTSKFFKQTTKTNISTPMTRPLKPAIRVVTPMTRLPTITVEAISSVTRLPILVDKTVSSIIGPLAPVVVQHL